MTVTGNRLLVGVCAALLLAAGVTPGLVSADPTTEDPSAFIIELEPNGDATVSLALTYELDGGDEEAAFETLREAPDNATQRFDNRLSRVADRTADRTGREMTISEVSRTVETADGTGVIRLSASWTNLAAVEGERLIVEEPFASGFRTDRTFVLVAPDGYSVSGTAVPADSTDGSSAEWGDGTNLSGFSATVEPNDGVLSGVSEGPLTPLALVFAVGVVGMLGYAGARLKR